MRRPNLVAVFIAAACAVIAPGQTAQQQQPGATLEGSVVNAITGQPLKGVSLLLEPEEGVEYSRHNIAQWQLRLCRRRARPVPAVGRTPRF